MRAGRVIRRVLLGLVATVALAAAVAYLLASRVPEGYRPARLSREQKGEQVQHFVHEGLRFMDEGEKVQPFRWSIGEDALNRYLESMDEIAFQINAKRGQAYRMMEKAGLSDPAVSLRGGVVRLMARSAEYEKIVSVGLRLEITPQRKLRVRLAGAWIGQLPVPRALLRGQIERLRSAVGTQPVRSAPSIRSAASAAPVGRVLQQVIGAVDGEPINTVMTWKVQTRKRVRVVGIDVDGGQLTLHVEPVRPEEAR